VAQDRKKALAANRRKALDRISELDHYERQRLFKRAAKLRKLMDVDGRARRERRIRPEEWDSEGTARPGARKAARSLHEWALHLLEQEPQAEDRASTEDAGLPVGIVVSVAQGACRVQVDAQLFDARLPAGIAACQKAGLAVGDRVELGGLASGAPEVAAVLPRTSRLSRPDPQNPHLERVLVANVEIVVIVVSVRMPPLRPRLVDRCLVAVERGGARPLICVNKLDLVESPQAAEAELSVLDVYASMGVPVLRCSAAERLGIAELRRHLAGRLVAFVGHSGVGKSSLLNALAPGLEQRTGQVREMDGRGRHTTTGATLHRLADGTQIIDTPGIRSLGLWKVGTRELRWYFPDFAEHAAACRYRDCLHESEPRCEVRAAAGDGRISAQRYGTYLRILATLDPEP
jgi:ribosome biogenesis GTPase / thiamine phosphate phosphatase